MKKCILSGINYLFWHFKFNLLDKDNLVKKCNRCSLYTVLVIWIHFWKYCNNVPNHQSTCVWQKWNITSMCLQLSTTLESTPDIIFDLMNHMNAWTQCYKNKHCYVIAKCKVKTFNLHVHSHVLILKVVLKGCCHFRYILCYIIYI